MDEDEQGTKAAWGGVFIIAAIVYGSLALAALAHEPRGLETRGGHLSEFITTLEGANQRGEEIRITSRRCISSCTIYLAADIMCTSRRTVYGFHCFSAGGKCSPEWNAYVGGELAKFSPILSKWFLDGPATTPKLLNVSGATMIDQFGARECGDTLTSG